MSDAPPPAIEERLTALMPRLRALRTARGAARLVLVALASACVVLLLDAAVPLAAWARGLFLSVWLTAVGVLAWRWVLIPWRSEIPLSEVASEIEKALPELGERLRTAVRPAPADQPAAIRAALLDDTARRLKGVDLKAALPVKPVAWLCAGAALALVAVGATAALVPGSGDRMRRVALPWSRPNLPPYRIVVTSGEPVVKRGDPVTLSAYAERAGNGAPTEAFVLVRDGFGSETREPMTADGGTFHFRRPSVIANFDYCIEIGTARSDWFRVTALDAVELAPDTRIEIVAPEYTGGAQKRTLAVLVDFGGLASSTVRFNLKFTRHAASAHFDWKPHDAQKSELIGLELAPDRLGANATFTLRTSGALKLVLVREEGGKKLRTETAVNVTVTQDEPPRFTQVSGVTARPRTARPGARIPISFRAADDWGITGANLTYTVNGDLPVTVPIPLRAADGFSHGDIDFDLTGKANEGDTVLFQIAVSDNRRDPERQLGPQVTVYPRNGWSELKLAANAPPLDQQDIICQRDALHDPLAAALKDSQEAATEAGALKTATANGAAFTVDQTTRLTALKEKVRASADALRAAATDAALTPELRGLAALVRAVADQKLKPAEDALRRAETDAARAEAFDEAKALLSGANGSLTDLRDRNAKFARDRLDRAKISALATDQHALAEAAKAGGGDLIDKQRKLLARLEGIIAESDALKAAVAAAKAEDVRRLASGLSELVVRVRELDAAARDTTAEVRAALVANIARDLDALTKGSERVFAEQETAARLAGVALPKPDDFRRVADLAAAGKTVDALTELDKHAQALAQIAAAFDKWSAERADPKLAAKQFALWQDDLLARFKAATNGTAFDKLPAEAKAAFRTEQKALHAAVVALALPTEATKARDEVLLHTGRVNDLLAGDGVGSDAAMKRASDALVLLAAQMPTVAKRLAKALEALEPLRQELDPLGNTIDAVLRASDRATPDAIAKKLAPSIEKLRKLSTSVAALDLPGLGERQARLVTTLASAISDMEDGSALDVPASFAGVRRAFERLKLVLESNPAADAKAEELHHKLAALTATLDAHGATITKQQIEPAAPVLQETFRQLTPLLAPEAPALLNDARNAVQAAEIAVRDAKPDEARRRVRAAVEALGKLADRLNGTETDYERVNRLAGLRRLAAEKPKELLTSDEAQRQLGRELDELTFTRVGAAGQTHKRRALDLYAKLRAKSDPDRIGSDLKALVTTLDELAAKMADIAELAVGPVVGTPPTPANPADRFLPSKPNADALRELVKQQRALHAQVTQFATELATRLRPAATNPLAALDAKQRRIALDALALLRESGSDAPQKAADAALRAADRVRVGQVVTAKEAGERAATAFRQLAGVGNDKPWAARAVELATRQEEVNAALVEFFDKPNVVLAQQVARAEELGREATEFADALEAAARALPATDATGTALIEAAKKAREAEMQLRDASKKAAEGNAADAEKFRAAAEAILRDASALVARAAPPAPPEGVNVAVGDALRAADKAMRSVIAALGPEGSAEAARKAMLDAVKALREAAK